MTGFGMSIGCKCCGCTIFDMRIAAGDEPADVEATIDENTVDPVVTFDAAVGYFELAPGAQWVSSAVCPDANYYVAIEFPPDPQRSKYKLHLDYSLIEGVETLNPGIVLEAEILENGLPRISDNALDPWPRSPIVTPSYAHHTQLLLSSDWTDSEYDDGKPKSLGLASIDRFVATDINVFDDCVEIEHKDSFPVLTLANGSTEIARLHRPRRENLRARVIIENTGSVPFRWRAIYAKRISDSPTSECEVVPKTYANFAKNEPLPIECELSIHGTDAKPRVIQGGFTTANSVPWSNRRTTIGNEFNGSIPAHLPISMPVSTMSHIATATPLGIVGNSVNMQFSLNISFWQLKSTVVGQPSPSGPVVRNFAYASPVTHPTRAPGSTITNGIMFMSIGYELLGQNLTSTVQAYRTEIGWPEGDYREFHDVLTNAFTFVLPGNVRRTPVNLVSNLQLITINKTIRVLIPSWDRGDFPSVTFGHDTQVGSVVGSVNGASLVATEANDISSTLPTTQVSNITWEAGSTSNNETEMNARFDTTSITGFSAVVSYLPVLKQ